MVVVAIVTLVMTGQVVAAGTSQKLSSVSDDNEWHQVSLNGVVNFASTGIYACHDCCCTPPPPLPCSCMD